MWSERNTTTQTHNDTTKSLGLTVKQSRHQQVEISNNARCIHINRVK